MTHPTCWCSAPNLSSFNEAYLRCQNCETLICRSQPESAAAFYGRDYWTTRQTDTLGHPDIYHRARQDLSDRAVYWLKTLLKYKRPPGATLELGSGHGGFSALLQWAGFQAVGLEPHAWVSNLSRTIFNIPTLTGRLADQTLDPQTLDVIILLDVLEHLPDPIETLLLCHQLLKPNGLLLIQTPCAPLNANFEAMQTAETPFLKMLLPLEHLYLYSAHGLRQLLSQTGFPYLSFEQALFPYDMFLVAAVSPLPEPDESNPAESLLHSPVSRLVLALLDLYDQRQEAQASEQKQRQRRHQLEALLQEAEADRAARLQQVKELNDRLQTTEIDRTARLEQIQTLAERLEQSEIDRAARKKQIDALSQQLETAETDRAARLEQITELTTLLERSEADRAARKAQIETLTAQLQEAENDRRARLEQIQTLAQQLEAAETDRTERFNQIEQLTTRLAEIERDSAKRLAQIEALTGWLETAETDRKARLSQVNELTEQLTQSETDRAARLEQITELTAFLEQSEADRAARLEQITKLTATVQSLQNQPDAPAPPDAA